jgi:nucleotide sugar dehydrogenase
MVNKKFFSQFAFACSALNTPQVAKYGEEQTTPFSLSSRFRYDLTPPSEAAEFDQDALLVTERPETIDSTTQPLIAIIGVGYVGQHLVHVFSKGYDVIGYDISKARINEVKKSFQDHNGVRFTTCKADLAVATHFLISVPTLLLPDKTIDLSFLQGALNTLASVARPGSTVVVESSVAVGITRELLGPLAREKGFFAGMSPERVDPGRTEPPAHAIPKIVSGLDDVVQGSLAVVHELYSKVFDEVVPVSSPEVAEMTKLYENCQRMVCIAYANEMADACFSHGIDPFEVCNAAATKPFGYMPVVPGLGVGGHCIPVNPYYLLSNNNFPILQAATEKMALRPSEIARRVVTRLCKGMRYCRPRILVVGMGFKAGQAHLMNSPGLEFAKSVMLCQKVEVSWADPLVTQISIPQIPRIRDEDWSVERLEVCFEMIVVAHKPSGLDIAILGQLRNVEVEMWCP